MAKIKATDKTLNNIVTKLTPSWEGCISDKTIQDAQVSKSQARNWLFGTIINKKFIKLSKGCNGFKKDSIVALIDIYDDDSAASIAGLIIYRLGNSGLVKEPTIAEA